ncbi:GAD-like domain-containing protein [Hahella ganghwensis]|uniref:GAD-like domain-containing protein n=1 Tax=Hahella ganghwensis TaxID=286420 RepID=UPI00037B1B76|nr:GAD-like domain-containing protein [Hahella ganghwensis]
MDEDFEWFLEQFGTPDKYKEVSQEVILGYRNVLPDQLLAYWGEFGFCSFRGRLFSTVDPNEYRQTMNTWLTSAQIPEVDKYHVIARSGFGDLFIWHETKGDIYVIEPRDSEIFQKKGNLSSRGMDDAIRGFFATKDPETIDLNDVDTDRPIFEDAVKKFGPLAPDEMFTFEPALFLGGEQTLKTVNKVNIHIQLELLGKMGTPQIMDINGLAKKAFS